MSTDTPSPDEKPAESLGISQDALLALAERAISSADSLASERTEGKEEQALESHEVVELQAFSERKVWIVEKIKFLEAMPPVELFVGLDAVQSSAPVVEGLPSREELKLWLIEHDKIEKETDIFDSGELKRFKKFTKAAAKRNLSPQDTDLIELTLTTILEFDRLLHLLRSRSENLDLLDIRLTWEEHRNAAWIDRSRIIDDLKTFLATRARWSPTSYEALGTSDEQTSPHRRGSIASVASDASILSLPGLSRAARYKQAESLSKEAAHFASRITSLRHGRITAAGKALDKLIDHSRKPVPEPLLDEQDKLEEQGISEMENVGKFVMALVTQWRKADEFYVETRKDQSAAQQLLDDLDTVKLSHPSQRQDVSFGLRTAAIVQRLNARGSPLSPNSTFPRPLHTLFPEQAEANAQICNILDEELMSALSVARSLEESVREYHAACEAVKTVDSKMSAAVVLTEKYSSVLNRLRNGTNIADGDGTPVDLNATKCLNTMTHSAYLALLPSLLLDIGQLDDAARTLVPESRAAILSLRQFAIDVEYKQEASATVDRLSAVIEETAMLRAEVETQVHALREARRFWSSAEHVLQDLIVIKSDIEDAGQRVCWKPPPLSLPATPESFSSPLPHPTPLSHFASLLGVLQSRLVTDVQGALPSLSPLIPSALSKYLFHRSEALAQAVEQVQQALSSAIAVEAQSTSLATLRSDVHSLRARVDDVQERCTQFLDTLLGSPYSPEEWDVTQEQLSAAVSGCEEEVQKLVSEVPGRIRFTATSFANILESPRRRRTIAGGDLTVDSLPSFLPFEPILDLPRLDEAVRSECNTFSVHLSGDVEALKLALVHIRAARHVRKLRQDLEPLHASLSAAEDVYRHHEQQLNSIHLSPDAGEAYGVVASEATSAFNALSADLTRMIDVEEADLSTLLAAHRGLDDVHGHNLVSPLAEEFHLLQSRYKAWTASFRSIIETAATLQQQADELLRKRHEEEAERARLELEAEQERQQQEAERRRVEEERRERQRVEAELRTSREREERESRERAERVQREQEAREEREKREREAWLEQERREQEMREEQERQQKEEQVRREMEEEHRKAEEARVQAEREKREAEARRAQEEKTAAEERRLREEAEDVFGSPQASTSARAEFASLSREVHHVRERLRDLGIVALARPSKSHGPSTLPTRGQVAIISAQFAELATQVSSLPPSVHYAPVDAELRSLRSDIAGSEALLQRVHALSNFVDLVQSCDAGLSDLLEHIDSYPSLPMGPLLSTHSSSVMDPPEVQLSSRIDFARSLVDDMAIGYSRVANDHRASSEQARITQTWQELEAMALDRVSGQKSRSPSVNSSGRSSRASIDGGGRPNALKKKASHYSTLSFGSPRGSSNFLSPGSSLSSRRSTSTGREQVSRPPSTASMASTRSTSGPMFSPSSRLFSSTFASRQRTTSLSSNASSASPLQNAPSRPRAPSGQRHPRVSSPALSDASTSSRSVNALARSTNSRSTNTSSWSRAPRLSFSSTNTPGSPPRSRLPVRAPRKAYVANQKSKLDVAVGDIVNNLPVAIDIEVADTSWQDQSGKYWIGTEDPKLCFCRILRSQTVMVRVGGGWQELSKFIQTHFADSFRLLPDTTSHIGSREEKWISSATLMEAPEILASPPRPPKTPEPSGIPIFAFSTPNGRSPHSIKSSPSSGSPLTPLQFMRRAEMNGVGMRPSTPSKGPSPAARPRQLPPDTPRTSAPVWRY